MKKSNLVKVLVVGLSLSLGTLLFFLFSFKRTSFSNSFQESPVRTEYSAEHKVLKSSIDVESIQAQSPVIKGKLSIGSDLSIEQCQNVGSDSPCAALETMLWAGVSGDFKTLSRLGTYNKLYEPYLQKFWDSLSESEKSAFHTKEEALAITYTLPFLEHCDKVRLIKVDVFSNSMAEVRFAKSDFGSSATIESTLKFQNTGSGWVVVYSDQAIEHISTKNRQVFPRQQSSSASK